MYLVAIAWIYVVLMMAVAEATNVNGTVLGAIVTFVLYGVAPVTLLIYLMRAPGRRRAIKAREAAELQAQRLADSPLAVTDPASNAPDASSHAPGAAPDSGVAPVRKEL